MMVLEFRFSFWQYGTDGCSQIPELDSSDEILFNYLYKISPAFWFSNTFIDFFKPSAYQHATQTGFYFYDTMHLPGKIVSLESISFLEFFLPQGVDMVFNNELMLKIDDWLENEGNNIIYLYGYRDPWTGAAVNPGMNTNSFALIHPTRNHNLSINSFGSKQRVLDSLNSWIQW